MPGSHKLPHADMISSSIPLSDMYGFYQMYYKRRRAAAAAEAGSGEPCQDQQLQQHHHQILQQMMQASATVTGRGKKRTLPLRQVWTRIQIKAVYVR